MSHRARLVQTCIAGAALFGSVLVYSAAHAQVGCCEGGSATGANAWTAGNNPALWGLPGPVFDPSDTWPAEAESEAGLKDGPAPYWWTHGELEIGGRDFVNNPRVGGATSVDRPTTGAEAAWYPYDAVRVGQQSLAKYYEYGIQAPGAFGGGHVAMGTSDGLWQLDLWANNVASNFAGFSDQAYELDVSKAGEHYFTFGWDSTPHVYSTYALTPFTIGGSEPSALTAAGIAGGSGARYLTLPAGFTPLSTATGSPNPGYSTIVPYLHPMDLGIQRDTASFAYRWTPEFGEGGWKDGALSQYDFNTYYSHMDRTGTQAGGIVSLWNAGNQATQIPVPIDDTTQNYGVNGERIGNTPWGKYTFTLGYSGSTYTDNISSYFVQNPFFPTLGSCSKGSGTTAGTANCVAGQMSTPPSNEMNSVSGTATADLPFKTRYAGTISYTDMTQNATFLPMTDNPNAQTAALAYGSVPWNQVNYGFINRNLAQPTTSLNGDIQTLLSNNVFTTPITSDVTSKFTYRYYDFNNGTPNILFPCWISYDQTGIAPSSGKPCGTGGNEDTAQSLSISYVKQNVGEEFNWRPDREWNFNAAYGYERYDWSEADVSATNENSGKLSADWRPNSWFDARLSGYFAERRYEGAYNYLGNVAEVQYPNIGGGYPSYTQANGTFATCSSPCISPAYRQFMYDNRDETKVSFLTNITLVPGVTISPSVKYQEDYYGINPNYNIGVDDSAMVSAGVDAVYVPRPDLSFSLSYYWEKYNSLFYSTSANGSSLANSAGGGLDYTASGLSSVVTTRDNEYVNTVVAAMNYAIIPNRLNFDLRAAVSDGLVAQSTACIPLGTVNPSNVTGSTCGAYPNDTNLFEHVEANLIYKFDPVFLNDTGVKDMKLKLRYTWERNAVANWQNDPLAPFTSSVNPTNSTTGALTNTALWMAYDNPNYNVQTVQASLIFQW
jgi:MtrB/PioB family decaheme-associated outer membrane protein